MNIEPWTLWAFVITVDRAAGAWTPTPPEPEAGR
jgi:hypothetical protein